MAGQGVVGEGGVAEGGVGGRGGRGGGGCHAVGEEALCKSREEPQGLKTGDLEAWDDTWDMWVRGGRSTLMTLLLTRRHDIGNIGDISDDGAASVRTPPTSAGVPPPPPQRA